MINETRSKRKANFIEMSNSRRFKDEINNLAGLYNLQISYVSKTERYFKYTDRD